MGARNYLIEGVSGSGKTTVCDELVRRGYRAIHGDRELAYQGDPVTGAPLPGIHHAHHIWDVDRVAALVAEPDPALFLCGGSRNLPRFLHLLDAVFVLDVDAATLDRRLAGRGDDEFGGRPGERALVLRLNATGEDLPDGIRIDSCRPVGAVVDDILGRCGLPERAP